MNIFSVPAAKYYCGSFSGSAGPSAGSFRLFFENKLKGPRLREGTPGFVEFRDCALREVERNAFFAISNYRRSLDLMIPGAASWAHVTLYYSAFFAARALLGMFGGWVGGKHVVEVAFDSPGKQEFVIQNKKQHTTYRGPHEQLWDIFYKSVPPLDPWLDPALRYAFVPLSSVITWQTETRNQVNYDSFLACDLAANFQASFVEAKFPASLPGRLSTQFSVTEGLLLILSRFMADFGLATDALASLKPIGARKDKLTGLVFHAGNPLLGRTKWSSVLV
jgi:hypothetical protein